MTREAIIDVRRCGMTLAQMVEHIESLRTDGVDFEFSDWTVWRVTP